MSEKVGRTFFDLVAENKVLALAVVALIALAVYEGYKFSFPGGFSITPPETKRDTVEISTRSEQQTSSRNYHSDQPPQKQEVKTDLFPISGKIEDETGKGIGGVQVSGKGITAQSDEHGRFQINLPFESISEEIKLTFEKEGFDPEYLNGVNRSQSQLTVPITLKKKN